MSCAPASLPCLNFAAGLVAVNQFAALGLEIAFFDMSRQRLSFIVRPVFFGVLGFESAAQDIFHAVIAARGMALVDQRFKIGRDVQLHGGLSVPGQTCVLFTPSPAEP